MARYRKKPIEIEAYKTDKEMIIHTLEGDMKANVGDYIITGIKGEQYPCKPEIFEATYEISTAEVAPKSEVDILKSTITHKEEEAYNRGYEEAKADILEKLQADIARDKILAEYGDELFEGRIAGFKAVMNYLNAEGEE